MRFYIPLTLLLLWIAPLSAQAKAPLEAFTWQNRIVLIFADTPESAPLQTQSAIDSKIFLGMVERDMELFTILSAARTVTPYIRPHILRAKGVIPDYAALNHDYNPKDLPFLVVLIGKDGGVKGQWQNPVSYQEIYGIIDAMPMRIREMNEE